MKKLLLLLFSMLISFNSFAEWTPVDINDDVTTFIDFNTIKKHNEFIYWWNMVEYEKESTTGKSAKFYVQGDCGISQTKILTLIAYNESMGKEELERETPDNPEWKYLTPDSVAGFLLDTSCRFINASDIEQQEILEEIQSKEELQRLLRIDEAKAKAKEDLEQELELRLLELKKLVQQEKQELNELSELRANKGWILGDPGTSAGLNAAIAKASEQSENWFTYYWSPTTFLAKYNLQPVDLGPWGGYDNWQCVILGVDNCADPQPSGWTVLEVNTVFSDNFNYNGPKEGKAYFAARIYPFAVLNSMLFWMDENQAPGADAAVHFLQNHGDVWKAWVDADVAAEVEAAL